MPVGVHNEKWPADGSLPPHVERFVDWLVDPENAPHNRAQWGRENGYNKLTVYNWLRDKRVRGQIELRADELNLRPDRIQGIVDSIYRAAVGGDMKAAALYLQQVDRLKPKRTIIEDRRIEDMSEEELRAALAQEGLLSSVTDDTTA